MLQQQEGELHASFNNQQQQQKWQGFKILLAVFEAVK
jgi:hypothetical protein